MPHTAGGVFINSSVVRLIVSLCLRCPRCLVVGLSFCVIIRQTMLRIPVATRLLPLTSQQVDSLDFQKCALADPLFCHEVAFGD